MKYHGCYCYLPIFAQIYSDRFMNIAHMAHDQLEQLSKKDLKYIQLADYLASFCPYKLDLPGFEQATKDRGQRR